MNTVSIQFDIPESSSISKEQFVRKVKDFAATLLSLSEKKQNATATPISDALAGCVKVPDDFDYKSELSER